MRKHLTYRDRLKLEIWYSLGLDKKEMASYLNVHISTIYRELGKGMYEKLNSDYTTKQLYSADIAQNYSDYQNTSKGCSLKIGNDYDFVKYVTEQIKKGDSPYAIICKNSCRTKVSLSTLYNYIHKGIFSEIKKDDMPYHKKERKQIDTEKYNTKNPLAVSISERPKEINERAEFGHWELDTVIGIKEKSNCLMVMTERKTRLEIIIKLKDKTANGVVSALDCLERIYKKDFSAIFKTITVDNGSENMNTLGMQRSFFNNTKQRTQIYYCHPYTSCERGSNENNNKLVRRHYKKGLSFDNVSKSKIADLQNWMNNYPRKLFDGRSSREILENLCIFHNSTVHKLCNATII